MPGLPACAAPLARCVGRRSLAAPQLERGGAARRCVRASWLLAAAEQRRLRMDGVCVCAPARRVSSRVRRRALRCCIAARVQRRRVALRSHAGTHPSATMATTAARADAGNPRQTRQPTQQTCSAPRRGRRASLALLPRRSATQAARQARTASAQTVLCASRWAHARAAELAHAGGAARVPFRARRRARRRRTMFAAPVRSSHHTRAHTHPPARLYSPPLVSAHSCWHPFIQFTPPSAPLHMAMPPSGFSSMSASTMSSLSLSTSMAFRTTSAGGSAPVASTVNTNVSCF
jgi:hypothetical protein